MTRGQQKIQSQQRNAKKLEQIKKQQGHDNKNSAQAALLFQCVVCRAQLPDPKTYRQHFDSKHPKAPVPDEIKDVQA